MVLNPMITPPLNPVTVEYVDPYGNQVPVSASNPLPALSTGPAGTAATVPPLNPATVCFVGPSGTLVPVSAANPLPIG